MEFNATKCVVLHFGKSNQQDLHSGALGTVEEQRDLEAQVHSSLKVASQVDRMVKNTIVRSPRDLRGFSPRSSVSSHTPKTYRVTKGTTGTGPRSTTWWQRLGVSLREGKRALKGNKTKEKFPARYGTFGVHPDRASVSWYSYLLSSRRRVADVTLQAAGGGACMLTSRPSTCVGPRLEACDCFAGEDRETRHTRRCAVTGEDRDTRHTRRCAVTGEDRHPWRCAATGGDRETRHPRRCAVTGEDRHPWRCAATGRAPGEADTHGGVRRPERPGDVTPTEVCGDRRRPTPMEVCGDRESPGGDRHPRRCAATGRAPGEADNHGGVR
ncbi:uncharacterized protein LOC144600591 [Rhinoraja longicauda]